MILEHDGGKPAPFACRRFKTALFQTQLFNYIGLMIGLGQGMTYVPEAVQLLYQSKDKL